MENQEQKIAYLYGAEFKQLLRALRLYTKSDVPDKRLGMIELWFSNEGVTGYACDGYKVIKYFLVCQVNGEFTVYIRSPRLWPYDKDVVAVEAVDEEKATVSFGEVQFTYKRPNDIEQGTLKSLYEKLEKSLFEKDDLRTICCNSNFLQQIAESFVHVNQGAASKQVNLTLGPSWSDPIGFQRGGAQAFLLPMRPTKNQSGE